MGVALSNGTQENPSIMEQAGKPILDNGTRYPIMPGRGTAIFVGAPLTNNTCQQSPISKTRPGRDIMVNRSDMISYRFRLHHNNKIESTLNTQPLSFSTPPSTVNSH